MTSDAATQERVFAFLMDPTRHPPTSRIDTHAASVFLQGGRALKIKRSVRFPFLDYSTLARRKAACEEEIRINRPFAPQIYHGVVAITEDEDGTLSLGGSGAPIEYAVDMSRFDENRTLDHLAKAGPFAPDFALGIADAIVAAHAAAPRVVPGGWIANIPRLIDGNCGGLRIGGQFADAEIAALAEASHRALARLRPLLEERGRLGFVRRCHGDLHLGNIVAIDGQPVLFDAIEFDPAIASIDILYDLAFTLMDLERYDQQIAANLVFNRYLARTPAEALDGLGALPLFMSIRAAIRAQVLLAKLERAPSDETAIRDAASGYFRLAQTLIQPPAPRLIAVGGLSGTGKSLLARMLAPDIGPRPGAVVLRSDIVRKQLFGVEETARLPSSAYQADVTERVYQALTDRARRVLAQGHSAVVDAVYAREGEREVMTSLAKLCNVRLTGLFLVADLATRRARIGCRHGDASDATEQVAALQEHYKIGHIDWTTVDASGAPEQTLERCRVEVGARN